MTSTFGGYMDLKNLSNNEQLNQLEQKLNELRSLNPNRPFPEEIWKEAIKLGKILGVSEVANRLKLNYSRLKHRVSTGKFKLPANRKGQKEGKKLVDSNLFFEVPFMPPVQQLQEARPQFKLQIHFGVKVFKMEWV